LNSLKFHNTKHCTSHYYCFSTLELPTGDEKGLALIELVKQQPKVCWMLFDRWATMCRTLVKQKKTKVD